MDYAKRIAPLGDALQRMVDGLGRQDGRQWSLFEDAPLPDDDRAGEPRPGARGRPPGARNRSTEQFRAFVRATRGDPGLALLDRVFADPKALAVALRAPSAWDVYKAQSEWLLRLLPYFWSAMPAELKVATKGALAVAISGTPDAYAGGDRVVEDDPLTALMKLMSNQPLSDVEPEPANDGVSNDPTYLPAPPRG
jgi:hypothetical protein